MICIENISDIYATNLIHNHEHPTTIGSLIEIDSLKKYFVHRYFIFLRSVPILELQTFCIHLKADASKSSIPKSHSYVAWYQC